MASVNARIPTPHPRVQHLPEYEAYFASLNGVNNAPSDAAVLGPVHHHGSSVQIEMSTTDEEIESSTESDVDDAEFLLRDTRWDSFVAVRPLRCPWRRRTLFKWERKCDRRLLGMAFDGWRSKIGTMMVEPRPTLAQIFS